MEPQRAGPVVPLRPVRSGGDDQTLLRAIRAQRADAAAELFDRYADHVRRVLSRIMGNDPELGDLMSEVFLQALRSIHLVKDGTKLKAWITRVSVFVARRCIRTRKRHRWLRFAPTNELPVQSCRPQLDDESADLINEVRQVLCAMPTEERIVFALRFFEEMEIGEIADACGVSMSTAKRRVSRCERLFKAAASGCPTLASRLASSAKWRNR